MFLENPMVKILGPKEAYSVALVETHNCAKFYLNWSISVNFLMVLG